MAIDLEKFSRPKDAVLPIVGGRGQYEQRVIQLDVPDGWYKVRLGDKVEENGQASPLQIEFATEKLRRYRGYPIGMEMVPFNFDQLFRSGFGETVPVVFLSEEPWEIISCIRWEDGNFYNVGPDIKANRQTIKKVKEAFEQETSLNSIKGVTPELRYYFLLHSMHRDAFRVAEELERLQLAEEERKKRIEEFRATFAGRLQQTIENAGGTLVRFYQRGRNYHVVWKVEGQQITSIIRDNEQVVSLGFCASGEDDRHTLSSAIKLAQMYYEQGGTAHGGLYITRS